MLTKKQRAYMASRKWVAANRQKSRDNARAWRKAHPEQTRAKKRDYYRRRRARDPKWVAATRARAKLQYRENKERLLQEQRLHYRAEWVICPRYCGPTHAKIAHRERAKARRRAAALLRPRKRRAPKPPPSVEVLVARRARKRERNRRLMLKNRERYNENKRLRRRFDPQWAARERALKRAWKAANPEKLYAPCRARYYQRHRERLLAEGRARRRRCIAADPIAWASKDRKRGEAWRAGRVGHKPRVSDGVLRAALAGVGLMPPKPRAAKPEKRDRERKRKYLREWKAKNPERHLAHSLRHRAKMKGMRLAAQELGLIE